MAKNDDDFDFGFSLVSEDELKSRERTLDKEVKGKTSLLKDKELTISETTARLENTVALFRKFLDKFRENPSSEYIYWPDRASKIDGIHDKITAVSGVSQS